MRRSTRERRTSVSTDGWHQSRGAVGAAAQMSSTSRDMPAGWRCMSSGRWRRPSRSGTDGHAAANSYTFSVSSSSAHCVPRGRAQGSVRDSARVLGVNEVPEVVDDQLSGRPDQSVLRSGQQVLPVRVCLPWCVDDSAERRHVLGGEERPEASRALSGRSAESAQISRTSSRSDISPASFARGWRRPMKVEYACHELAAPSSQEVAVPSRAFRSSNLPRGERPLTPLSPPTAATSPPRRAVPTCCEKRRNSAGSRDVLGEPGGRLAGVAEAASRPWSPSS